MKEPEAARQVLDLVASHRSELDSEAISWVYSAAYKVFREEATKQAREQIEAERKRKTKPKRGWWL
jgi:hypothetical protein